MIKDWYTQHEGKWHQIEDVQDTGIPAHKPGGGNKIKLKGKDKWVHASEVKGLEPKPPITKSEAISKLKELAKGSAQRRIPFDPNQDIGDQDRVTTESWTSGHYDTPRSEVPKLEGNAKQRGMHKLHKLTQSRKNPKTGEREFLLYRGKTVGDHRNGGIEETSSFTPSASTAIGFAESINRALLHNPASLILENKHGHAQDHIDALDSTHTREGKLAYAKKHLNKVYRAWVPESAIHHIPNAIGSKSRGLFDLHSQLDKPKKQLRHEEHEVIVNTKGLDMNEHTIDELPGYKVETRSDKLRERLNDYLRNKGKMKKSELSKAIPTGKHNDAIRQVADSYAEGKGFKLNHDFVPPKVDPTHAANIARAYHDMKHDPHHPDVKQAYNDLINETAEQYNHIVNTTGMKFSKMTPGQENPYKTSKALFDDIKNNNHMWYYPTESGFGSGDNQTSDHPLMQDVKVGENTMKANDMFRVVHDVFGHAKEGFSFGPEGEEKAWNHHMQMYSPSAQRALTSETRGQNSWVNFGPHGEQNRKDPANTVYAEQKAGLLPHWAHGPAAPNKPITKAEAISKLKKLTKGSAQRRMPFNPTKDVHDDEANKILSWQEDEEHDAKEQIKPMEGNLRRRALHRLHGMTQSRIHPKTGEKEFLLHRGITNSNEELGLGDFPSFTTDKDVAADFASTNTIGDSDVISSWVPESRIHHMPKMIGRFGEKSFHPDEGEVIVDNRGKHIDHTSGKGIYDYTDSRKHFRDKDLQPPKNVNERIKSKMTAKEAIEQLRKLKKQKFI